MPSPLLTIDQAAERLQVSTRTVRRWITEGVIPARRLGRRAVRIAEEDLEAAGRPLQVVRRRRA